MQCGRKRVQCEAMQLGAKGHSNEDISAEFTGHRTQARELSARGKSRAFVC
jgi:hypothetical protein